MILFTFLSLINCSNPRQPFQLRYWLIEIDSYSFLDENNIERTANLLYRVIHDIRYSGSILTVQTFLLFRELSSNKLLLLNTTAEGKSQISFRCSTLESELRSLLHNDLNLNIIVTILTKNHFFDQTLILIQDKNMEVYTTNTWLPKQIQSSFH